MRYDGRRDKPEADMAAAIRIRPLTPALGAEVEGIDLAAPLADDAFAALNDAWAEHLVLFFRDQRLDPASLQRLGRRFGPLHRHPQGDVEGFEGIIRIHTDRHSKTFGGSKWHADASCDREPPTASILHMEQVPRAGGDTLFANAIAAFEALSAPMQRFLEGLTARHVSARHYGGYFGTRQDETRDGAFPEAVHPVIALHPASGRKAIYVNQIFTESVLELSADESAALLEFLFRHIAQPRFQCRFHWRANSVALWDNRATQHLAIWDYWPQTRCGHRVTIAGEAPCGP